MNTTTTSTPGTQKVRRESLGSKRAPGWEWQQAGKRVRRASADALGEGKVDPSLSGVGGLVSFNQFVQADGVAGELYAGFGHMKRGAGVVYPMHTQMQTLIDAYVAGAKRVFDFEWLAADPLFAHLAGGAVSSIDTIYDDLRRFEPEDLERLEGFVAAQGLQPIKDTFFERLTIDIDSTVTVVFGEQEGAAVGYNPRHPGRQSYHPLLARVAETDTILGARLRPGDTTLGEGDVEDIEQWLDRVHEASPNSVVTVRIDAGGDCATLLSAVDRKKAYFVVKLHQTAALVGAVWAKKSWHTVDRDADGKPSRQVAVIDFARKDWPEGRYRVFAVRTNERVSGKQSELWSDSDLSVHVFVTNDFDRDIADLARLYDDRAGIEPLIGELKNAFGIGKVSTGAFNANEAALLLKLLAYNLMRRWVAATCTGMVCSWRASWIRRACVLVPARLLRSGGRWVVRLAPRPMLN